MKKGWGFYPLEAVCLVRRGTTITNKEAVSGDVPVVAGGLLPTYYHNAANRPAGTITVSASGANAGYVNRYVEPIFASDCSTINPIDEQNLLADFVFRFLQSKQQYISSELRRGSAQPHVYASDLGKLEIPIPPMDEQRRIVAVLDKAFAGIATATANAQNNLTNARALFDSELNAIFTKSGAGWTSKTMEDVAILTRGHNPPKSKFSYAPKEGYVRFFQIRDGKSEKNAVYVPDSPQLHRVEPEDILMVAYRHVGRVFRGVSGAFNVALCKIKNRDRDVILDDYLYHIIPTDFVRGELLKRSERSLIPSMSVHHLKEIVIPVPPIERQYEIVHRIGEMERLGQSLEHIYQQKLVALNELKQSLLQKAFAGELT